MAAIRQDALIGGETAEMPGFYPEDEYDLAGFSVGVIDKADMVTGANLKAGDVLVGISSKRNTFKRIFTCPQGIFNEEGGT